MPPHSRHQCLPQRRLSTTGRLVCFSRPREAFLSDIDGSVERDGRPVTGGGGSIAGGRRFTRKQRSFRTTDLRPGRRSQTQSSTSSQHRMTHSPRSVRRGSGIDAERRVAPPSGSAAYPTETDRAVPLSPRCFATSSSFPAGEASCRGTPPLNRGKTRFEFTGRFEDE